MRKFLMVLMNTVAFVAIAGVAMAAEGVVPTVDLVVGLAYATALGMGLAAAGCGIAQGLGVKAACEGTARNPEASGKLTVTMLIGLAMIESLAIYALVVNLILLFVTPHVG